MDSEWKFLAKIDTDLNQITPLHKITEFFPMNHSLGYRLDKLTEAKLDSGYQDSLSVPTDLIRNTWSSIS